MMNFQQAYPSERLEKTEKHLREVWKGTIPCTYTSLSQMPYYRQMEDTTGQVALAAENILHNAKYPGYNMPRVIIDYGTVSTAAYWGGRVRLPVGGCLSIEPIIRSPEQADGAQPGDPSGMDSEKGEMLFRQVCGKLNTNRLYCTTFDIQGPLGTAALLWEQTDFMMAMIDEPETVHRLLARTTDHIIQMIEVFVRRTNGMVCGNVWPFIWLPTDIGVAITEDYMPLLSPEMYKEFGIPYVERISKAFGGVFIHCCGEYERHLETLRDSDINLLGLEFHYPYVRPEALFDTFGSSVLFVPYLGIQDDPRFESKMAYFEYLAKIKKPDTRLWFSLHPEDDDYEEQLKIVRKICQEDGA